MDWNLNSEEKEDDASRGGITIYRPDLLFSPKTTHRINIKHLPEDHHDDRRQDSYGWRGSPSRSPHIHFYGLTILYGPLQFMMSILIVIMIQHDYWI